MRERGNPLLRYLDRYAGIPVVLLLSLFSGKGRPARPDSIRNVLAIKLGTIGDTLLLMPVLKAVKDGPGRSGRSLTVVCSANNREVLSRYPFIDRLIIFEVSRAVSEPFYFKRFMQGLNSEGYDLVLDFEPWSRISSIISFFTASGHRAGFRTAGQKRDGVYDTAVSHRGDIHESENYKNLAAACGIGVKEAAAGFPVSEEESRKADACLLEKGVRPEKLIVIHPWSSGYRGRFKEWGESNFAALSRLLMKEGFDVGITGGDTDRERAAEIARACPGATSFAGDLTLGETAALIRRSLLLITVNTGIMHLGAALNHPMLTLNGPAGVLRWGPTGDERAVNIESPADCAPCLNLGFEYGCRNAGCMDEIKAEEVFAKAQLILSLKEKTTR